MQTRIAILDMNDGVPNQGLRCITEIVETFSGYVSFDVFDVRAKCQIPGTDYDIYISSGGPGSPYDGDGIWDRQYYQLIDDLWQINATGMGNKHVFFICHSFQMACLHFGIGNVTNRQSMSFGIFPVFKTISGVYDPILRNLPDPFFAADFRRWQVINPTYNQLLQIGAQVLARENFRYDHPEKRALMAIRFSDKFLGVQFHPEADPIGMRDHFLQDDKRKEVIAVHGEDTYMNMIEHLYDSEKLQLTHNLILPKFISSALRSIKQEVSWMPA